MSVDGYKRELLYRKAHGKSLISLYKTKLSLLLGTQPDDTLFLSLSETDDVIKKLMQRKSLSTENAEFTTLSECLKCYSTRVIDGEYVLLLDEDWRYCGAYRVRNVTINADFDFNRLQSDEIRLISEDLRAEIAIDYCEFYNEEIFELRITNYES